MYWGLVSNLMGGRRRQRAAVFSENAGAMELVGDFAFSQLVRMNRVEFWVFVKAGLKNCSTNNVVGIGGAFRDKIPKKLIRFGCSNPEQGISVPRYRGDNSLFARARISLRVTATALDPLG